MQASLAGSLEKEGHVLYRPTVQHYLYLLLLVASDKVFWALRQSQNT